MMPPMYRTLEEFFLGKAKDPLQKGVFHRVSLIAFLAWIGLGADGLSSAAYGPPEAYKALVGHHGIALYLALATAATVFIISASYNQIIELFPSGGGGYVVASKLLIPAAGLVSGGALLVDYILDISISIAAGVDAVASFVPWMVPHKLSIEVLLTILLIWLNLRGIKESIKALLPIFMVFVGTHILLVVGGVWGRASQLGPVVQSTLADTHQIVSGTPGLGGFIVLFFTAYSLGGGTYTGLEAVSNGLATLREPRVKTGQRTMLYMAVSLAFTAGGILLLYLLWDVRFLPNKTLNTSLAEAVFNAWSLGGLPVGPWIAVITILSEGFLLFIAAQTGFIDGPNVLANLAVDSWMPHRFANLSHQLVRINGVLVMGISSLVLLLLCRGDVDVLIVLFSINVFITFNLSQLSMCLHWWRSRKEDGKWKGKFFVNGLGLSLTSIVLVATLLTKFMQGGFVTLLITGALIWVCFRVKGHYAKIQAALDRLDASLKNLPLPAHPAKGRLGGCDESQPIAVIMMDRFSGLGIHAIFSIQKLFRKQFKDFLFVSVARIDSSKFKGLDELQNLRKNTEDNMMEYVELAHRMGYRADYQITEGVDVIEGMEKLCDSVAQQYPDVTFFSGKLVFAQETFWTRFLHNHTALEIQRRLLFKGYNMMIVPVRLS